MRLIGATVNKELLVFMSMMSENIKRHKIVVFQLTRLLLYHRFFMERKLIDFCFTSKLFIQEFIVIGGNCCRSGDLCGISHLENFNDT